MVYLVGLLFRWIARALVPTTLFLAAGTALVLLVWLLFLRRRRRAVARAWLALGIATACFGSWRTWCVWHDFKEPQFSNFRSYVADPIPDAVRNLAMDSAAPAMFHDGALVRFEAPAAVVEAIASHALPGTRALALVEEMKQRSGRDPANRAVVAGPDGRSWLRVAPDRLLSSAPEDFRWARTVVKEAAERGRGQAYVLAMTGEWGSFQAVMIADPASSQVTVRQFLERRWSR